MFSVWWEVNVIINVFLSLSLSLRVSKVVRARKFPIEKKKENEVGTTPFQISRPFSSSLIFS
jgi:hypothetical protein